LLYCGGLAATGMTDSVRISLSLTHGHLGLAQGLQLC